VVQVEHGPVCVCVCAHTVAFELNASELYIWYVHLDSTQVEFEGQGHRSKFPVTEWTGSTGTVHTSTKARLTSVATRIRIRIRIRMRDPHRHENFNRFVTGPLPNFRENFMQIRSDVFAKSF